MKTIRSKEEKEKLIEDCKSSALSINEWCVLNSIPRSTMAGWLNAKGRKSDKDKKKTKFIEVTQPVIYNTKQDSPIVIDYKDFNISVHKDTDFELLENTLRVVASLNV